MSKVKVTISLEKKSLEEIDKVSKFQKTNRSALIEEAIKVWQKGQLEKELKQGYIAMRDIDRKTAEENLNAGIEVINGE